MNRKVIKYGITATYGVVTDDLAVTLSVYLAEPPDPDYGPKPMGIALVVHFFGPHREGSRMAQCKWNPKGSDCDCDSFHELYAGELVEKHGHGTETMWKELEELHKSRRSPKLAG